VIYDAFRAAVHVRVPRDKAGILVDEQFGASILYDAVRESYFTSVPAEKSGQDEFDFEYGDDFGAHIEAFHPTFCKVLVRYNPEGDQSLNQRQTARLKRLSEYLHSDQSRSRFMFELLVPAEKPQLDRVKGDKKAYDLELRPGLMAESIEQLQDAGVEPDVWKIEGLDRGEDCERVVGAARRKGRDRVGSGALFLAGVRTTRRFANGSPPRPPFGFIGFAVGRTSFWAAAGLACEEDHAGCRRCRDCQPLLGLRRCVRNHCRDPQGKGRRVEKEKGVDGETRCEVGAVHPGG